MSSNKVAGASSSRGPEREQDAPATLEPALTPKLRFPAFRNGPRWENKRLDNVCTAITQGGTPDTSVPEFWNGNVCWITPAEMGRSENPFVHTTERKITDQGLKNCSSELLPINSVILSTRAPIGHLAINKTPMAINQGCKGLIPSHELDFRFLYFSLATNKRRLNDLGSGNTFKELSGAALKSFTASFPQLAEQQKIAECLSTLDELIGAESQKLDALKAHKNGLMQQLFPREGETIPRLRFPEFHSAPEWNSARLEDICELITKGATPTSYGFEYVSSGVRFVKIESLLDGAVDFSKTAFITNDCHEAFLRSQLREHDLLFSIAGALGLVAIVGSDVLPANINQALALIRLKGDHSSQFLLHYLGSSSVQTLVQRIRSGAAQPNLSLGQLGSFEILLPAPAEQHRIATCLSSLDDLIAAQGDRLAALQTHKQGLLQQLFPSPAAAVV